VSHLGLTQVMVARLDPYRFGSAIDSSASVSVIVPARNEAGHIEEILARVPAMGSRTEILFVEGNSTDDTLEVITREVTARDDPDIRFYQQPGIGKGDAVRHGYQHATGDVLMILDADMTVAPEDLPRFFEALANGSGEFINGVRLVYPMEDEAMRFLNYLGNKFFGLTFSWLLQQPVKDTLCGTKVLTRTSYDSIAANRSYFGDFDPFGDFDLLFGAAKSNLKIVDIPIRYRQRRYGSTNIDRWRHGVLLLEMAAFAARKLRFI
jgi:glycosyltransferase involved in cell wall biosynthesis